MAAAPTRLTIGTRGSALARWQAEWVKNRLQAAHPDLDVSLANIKTTGDKILDVPLANVGGKGLFVKEIEEALLAGTVDLAVHSMKDVPTVLPAALHLAAIPQREDPYDALISRSGLSLAKLPEGATIGTSSLRRQAQLLAYRNDFTIASLRGRLHRYAGVPLIVTYHPAYLLRNLPDKAKSWADLRFAVNTLDTLRSGAQQEKV